MADKPKKKVGIKNQPLVRKPPTKKKPPVKKPPEKKPPAKKSSEAPMWKRIALGDLAKEKGYGR
jgi:hypothetical protein